MAEVNVTKSDATKTARSGDKPNDERGEHLVGLDAAANTGVKMDSKDKKATDLKTDEKVSGGKNKSGGTKSIVTVHDSSADKSEVKVLENKDENKDKNRNKDRSGKGGQVKIRHFDNRSGDVEKQRDKLIEGDKKSNETRPKNTEKGLVLRGRAIDPEIALMASRAASAERVKPDIVKVGRPRRSVSGMVVETSRPSRRNAPEIKTAEVVEDKKDAGDGELRFTKAKSALIGVGVALAVAIVGFVGIAIFGNNKKMCTVHFESNGGSEVDGTEIVCGRTVKQPDDPVKEGFSFQGWILEGDPFDFDNGIYRNAILVAKWQANEGTEVVTVKFDTDGGSEIKPIEVAKGKTLTRPSAPTKMGYVFDDWYLDGKVYDFDKPVEKDITLKAKWEKRSTVVQNNSGNSGNSNNKPSSSDNNTAKPTNNRVTSLSVGNMQVTVGKSVTATVTVIPSAAEYSLIISSSNNDVANCSITGNSLVCSGKKAGTATVTVKDVYSGNVKSFKVTVMDVIEEEKPTEPEKPPVEEPEKPPVTTDPEQPSGGDDENGGGDDGDDDDGKDKNDDNEGDGGGDENNGEGSGSTGGE